MAKNRAVNELLAQAEALQTKIADPSSTMTGAEVESALQAIQSFKSRAQAVAGFTPEAVAAERGLVPVESPEMSTKAKSLKDDVAELNNEVRKNFGSVGNFMKAVGGYNSILNDEQKATIHKSQKITKAVIGTASDTSGGEFVLPLEQVKDIFGYDASTNGILGRARRYEAAGRSLRIPYRIQDTGSVTRPGFGISAVSIVGEGSSMTSTDPKIGQRSLTVYKYMAITQVGNETLGDDYTGQLQTAIENAVGADCVDEFNYDITINGAGTSSPLGALHANNTSLLSVTRTVASSSGYLHQSDLINMFSQHTAGPNSFWLVSRPAYAGLLKQSTSGSIITYMPNTNVSPSGLSLLGMPVVISEFLPTLGTTKDVALINPDHYAVAVRQALTVEASPHVAFNSDLMTFRFGYRAGGLPIPTSTYAYIASGGTKANTHSPFVVLSTL